MEITLLKNKEKAPSLGKRFGQDVEPAGYYAIKRETDIFDNYPNYEVVKVTYQKPLIITVNDDTLVSWKYDLSKKYKANGKKLSEKLMKEGYDIIITQYEKGDTGEIIVLNTKLIEPLKFNDGGKLPDEQKAKEFLDNIPKEEWENLTHAFKEALNEVIKTETEKLESLKSDFNANEIKERELWEKQKTLQYGKEQSDLMNQRMGLKGINSIRAKQIMMQQNIVDVLSNGGDIVQFTDAMGHVHSGIPNFTQINATNISFDEENILLTEKPKYIPLIDEEKFKRKGYIFDAIRISIDKYILSTTGFEKTSTTEFKGETTGHTADYYQPLVLVTLDQLVLILDYYYKKAKAIAIKEAEESTKRQEEYYDKLSIERRKKHIEQKDFYKVLPAAIKKKITQSEYEALTFEEKEKIYKPFKRVGPKRLVSVLEDNKMWSSFHDMYQRFVNPNAHPINKEGVLQPGKSAGLGVFGNPETFKYWYQFRDMMEFKIKDIKVQRTELSDIRKEAIETSFGIKNTDTVLQNEYGILVKRQNGEKINATDIEQIRDSWVSVNSVFGNLKDLAFKNTLKISHTGKTLIFASKAAGVLVPSMGTISVSNKFGENQFKLIMAHEVGHFIDNEFGKLNGKRWATDDYESKAGIIAFTFRNHMNKPKNQQTDYINATKECFARAMEQFFAFEYFGEDIEKYYSEDRTMPYHNSDAYLNKEKFNTLVKPLVESFLSENKEIFTVPIIVAGNDKNDAISTLELLIELGGTDTQLNEWKEKINELKK